MGQWQRMTVGSQIINLTKQPLYTISFTKCIINTPLYEYIP
jgi:hypothetical protein